MTQRGLALILASVAVAFVLVALLVWLSDIDLRGFVAMLREVRVVPAMLVAATMAAMAWCSGMKWRLLWEGARSPHRTAMPKGVYFGFSALGMALGQVLPSQVATSVARGLGLRLIRRGTMIEGTAATLVEQVFDLLVALLCGSASVLMLVLRLEPAVWLLASVTFLASGLTLVHGAAVFGHGLLRRWDGGEGRGGRTGAMLTRLLGQLSLLQPRLIWRLTALSIVRYAALIGGAYAAAWAGDLPISLYQIAVAIPLVVLAVLLSFAPGGFGVNEWGFASALAAVGVPFSTAVTFALLNRLLNVLGAVLVGALACALLAARAVGVTQSDG